MVFGGVACGFAFDLQSDEEGATASDEEAEAPVAAVIPRRWTRTVPSSVTRALAFFSTYTKTAAFEQWWGRCLLTRQRVEEGAAKAAAFRTGRALYTAWEAWSVLVLDKELQDRLVVQHYDNLIFVRVWASWVGLHMMLKHESQLAEAEQQGLAAASSAAPDGAEDVDPAAVVDAFIKEEEEEVRTVERVAVT